MKVNMREAKSQLSRLGKAAWNAEAAGLAEKIQRVGSTGDGEGGCSDPVPEMPDVRR